MQCRIISQGCFDANGLPGGELHEREPPRAQSLRRDPVVSGEKESKCELQSVGASRSRVEAASVAPRKKCALSVYSIVTAKTGCKRDTGYLRKEEGASPPRAGERDFSFRRRSPRTRWSWRPPRGVRGSQRRRTSRYLTPKSKFYGRVTGGLG